jgi:hypothetical protein
MLKSVARWIMAAFFIVAGANHFISPSIYLELMPPYLGDYILDLPAKRVKLRHGYDTTNGNPSGFNPLLR